MYIRHGLRWLEREIAPLQVNNDVDVVPPYAVGYGDEGNPDDAVGKAAA